MPKPKPPSAKLKKPDPRVCGEIRYRVIRPKDAPREDGRWYWRAEKYGGGTSENIWNGWATVAEADQIVAGITVGIEPESERLNTVRDLLAVWHGSIELREDLDPKTIAAYGDGAVRVRDAIGNIQISKLDRLILERMVTVGLQNGRTHRGVQSDLKILKIAWKWGRDQGLIPSRDLPIIRMIIPELDHPEPAPEDVSRIIGMLRPEVRMAVLLLASTGARRCEICNLQHRDIEKKDGTWWLRLDGKGSKIRRVPVIGYAGEALADWIAERPGEPDSGIFGYTPATMQQYIHRELHAAGQDWQPHDLRRTAVDRLYDSGVDPGTASRMMGHSPQTAIRNYRRVGETRLLKGAQTAGMGDGLTAPVECKVIPMRRKLGNS